MVDLDAEPDPTFFNHVYPDPAFRMNADPDPREYYKNFPTTINVKFSKLAFLSKMYFFNYFLCIYICLWAVFFPHPFGSF
jgi:hypothetical protein